MCGIIHCKKTDPSHKANKTIKKRYYSQKSRGTEGFGFVEIKNGVVIDVYRSETEAGIMKALDKSTADEILFHHRYPTSTPNFVEATHPIKVSHDSFLYDYYVVHNGIITNDERLREKHIKNGFVYTTEIVKAYITRKSTYSESAVWNDSEAMAIDFALSIENKKDMECVGSIALVALQVDKVTNKVIKLFWGRNNGNPLCMEDSKEMLCLSSQTGESIKDDLLFSYDYEKNELTSDKKDIGEYFGYRNYTPSNITPKTEDKDKDAEDKSVPSPWNLPERTQIGFKDRSNERALEENDYILDLKEEIDFQKGELKKARDACDYDKELDIEIELEGLEATLLGEMYAMGID